MLLLLAIPMYYITNNIWEWTGSSAGWYYCDIRQKNSQVKSLKEHRFWVTMRPTWVSSPKYCKNKKRKKRDQLSVIIGTCSNSSLSHLNLTQKFWFKKEKNIYTYIYLKSSKPCCRDIFAIDTSVIRQNNSQLELLEKDFFSSSSVVITKLNLGSVFGLKVLIRAND